ncbi:MAG: hypothetical protein V8Q84_07740 [Bilophila sp.]
MSLDIILLILVAALLHASWNAVIKGGTNKLYETGLNCFGGGVGVLFVVPFLPLPAPESLIFWRARVRCTSPTTCASRWPTARWTCLSPTPSCAVRPPC